MRWLATGFGVAAVAFLAGCGDSTSESRGRDITITATLGGFAWHADQGDIPPRADFDRASRGFSLAGTAGIEPTRTSMGFELRNVTGPGVYPLGDPTATSCGHLVRIDGYFPEWFWTWYWTSSTVTGTATVTAFDPQRRFIKGTFSFDAVDDDGSIVQIRDGTFRAYYNVH